MYMATSACTDGVARLGLYSAICLSPLDADQYADTPRALRSIRRQALSSSPYSLWDSWKPLPAPIGYCAYCARIPMLAGVVRIRRNKQATGKQPHDLAAGWSGMGALRPRSKWSTVNRDEAAAL
jgi:hypothetical protein